MDAPSPLSPRPSPNAPEVQSPVPGRRSYSALSSLMKAAVDVLDAEGLDKERILDARGVAIPDFEDRSSRVPMRSVSRAWRVVTEHIPDPAVGVRAAYQHFNPADWQSLGLAILCSNTLRQALERVERYFDIVSDAGEIRLEETPQDLVFVGIAHDDTAFLNWTLMEFGLSSLLILLQRIMPDELHPRRIDLLRPRELASDAFEELLKCPVHFGCARERVYFSLDMVDTPLGGSNEALAAYQDTYTERYIASINSGRTTTRVRKEITRLMLGRSPRLVDVADKLHVSPRQLQRKLAQEDTTFEEIVAEIRQHLSTTYLAKDSHSLSEISFLLGYSSQSNFTRAFRQWFGVTPMEYRRSSPG